MKVYGVVEAKTREAIERCDFDNLPNKGKPLDLSDWLKTPEHLRMSHSILKNAGYSPSEVNAKKKMAGLRAMIEQESDQGRKQRLLKQLDALEVTNAIRMEKLRK